MFFNSVVCVGLYGGTWIEEDSDYAELTGRKDEVADPQIQCGEDFRYLDGEDEEEKRTEHR